MSLLSSLSKQEIVYKITESWMSPEEYDAQQQNRQQQTIDSVRQLFKLEEESADLHHRFLKKDKFLSFAPLILLSTASFFVLTNLYSLPAIAIMFGFLGAGSIGIGITQQKKIAKKLNLIEHQIKNISSQICHNQTDLALNINNLRCIKKLHPMLSKEQEEEYVVAHAKAISYAAVLTQQVEKDIGARFSRPLGHKLKIYIYNAVNLSEISMDKIFHHAASFVVDNYQQIWEEWGDKNVIKNIHQVKASKYKEAPPIKRENKIDDAKIDDTKIGISATDEISLSEIEINPVNIECLKNSRNIQSNQPEIRQTPSPLSTLKKH